MLAQAPSTELDEALAAIEARLQTLEARTVGVYFADEWLQPGMDLADAVDVIQRDPGCAPGDEYHPRVGCRILLGREAYTTKPITLCRQVVLEGISGAGWGAATVIKTDGETGIHVSDTAHCESLGFEENSSGAWSSIRDLALQDVGNYGTPLRYSAGILMEARAEVTSVWIRGFTQGIRICAGHARETVTSTAAFFQGAATNANAFRLINVTVDLSRHSGVFIDGADVNAGYTLGVNSTRNCKDADLYTPHLGPCANLHESSFLGNTHIAPHSADAKDLRDGQHHQYLSDNVNARNVWLGPYSESGDGVSIASRQDIVLGGLSAWDGSGEGIRFQDGFLDGFCTWDDRPGQRPFGEQLCLGRFAGGGVFAANATIDPFKTSRALRLKPGVLGNAATWMLGINNLGVLRVLEIDQETAELKINHPARRD